MTVARVVGLIFTNLVWAGAVLRQADRRFAAAAADPPGEARRAWLDGPRILRSWDRVIIVVVAPGLAVACSYAFASGWVAGLISTFLVFCAVVSLRDLRWRIIPNALVYPAFVLYAVAVVALWAVGTGLHPTISALGLVAYGGGLLLLALLWPGGMGMGDVKLAGLTGFVLGALGWSYVSVAAAGAVLFGGVIGVIVLILGGRRTKIPFGPYLALGAVVSAFTAPHVARWYLGRLG